MGIFSKFQIKDIKSKILGGKVKHKVEVPAIAVIPPIPSVKADLTFPGDSQQTGEPTSHIKHGKKSRTLTRQRSYSMSDCVNQQSKAQNHDNDEQFEQVDVYLKLPRCGRRKRKSRKRSPSCPENLSGFITASAIDIAGTMKGNSSSDCSNVDGPTLTNECEKSLELHSTTAEKAIGQIITESQEFGFAEKRQDKLGGISSKELFSDEVICQNNQISGNDNANDNIMNYSGENSDFGETILPFHDQSDRITSSDSIRRRVSKSNRPTPEMRWSLDLERLQAGCSENSIDEDNDNMKWDGQSPNMSPKSNGKGLVSTWSLDLDIKTSSRNPAVERAHSEMNVGGSPSFSQRSETHGCSHVIYNAKSLDLDLVMSGEVGKEDLSNSDNNVFHKTSLKKGLNGYIGKLNGIVSKFSTWSLDVELNRKRSLDNDLNESNRAQSENLLDAVDTEPSRAERSLSYHALLYDIDEASRYQIYQPTVYEISDEGVANEKPDGVTKNMPGTKPTQHGNSMKFLSRQFDNLYENGRSLYRQRYVIIDAIKQREKELKAIADRQTAEKALPTEQIFKPNLAQKPRSYSYTKQRFKNAK